MEHPINQSSWGRAKQDTITAQTTAWFMWGGEGVLAVAGGAWLAQIAPLGASTLEIVLRSVIGGLGGLCVAVIAIFAWNLSRASYRQRNEAYAEITRLEEAIRKQTGEIDSDENELDPLKLIDSFPKDNESITTEDVKKIFLKFNKPIDKQTEMYISNYFIKENSRAQWNIHGFIEYSENDTRLNWHVKDHLLKRQDEYGPMDIDYPTFEIRIGIAREIGMAIDRRIKATDGSSLPVTVISVKIKPKPQAPDKEGFQLE